MKIRWTKAASDDLDSIENYIWQDNPKAAVRQVLRILKAVKKTPLGNLVFSGRDIFQVLFPGLPGNLSIKSGKSASSAFFYLVKQDV